MTYPFEGSTIEPADIIEPHDLDSDAVETELDDEPGEAENTASSAERKPPRRKVPRGGARLSPAQVRRVLSQAAFVEQQDGSVRDLLAATLGTTSSTEDLVIATLGATKAGEVISELLAVASEENAFTSVTLTHALLSERDNARRVWALLTALGKVTGGIPAKDIQAATSVAAAAKDLDLDDLTRLELVTELLG